MQQLVQTLESRVSDRTRDLEKLTARLRELSVRLLRTQDQERRRIARELHDGVGQLLAAVNMNLSKLKREKDSLSSMALAALDESFLLVDHASQGIRTMSHLLHPPLLDEVGLESALRWYVEGFADRSKIKVCLQLADGFGKNLPRDLSLALFRVVQECLTNVHRHSGSQSAVVSIRRTAESLTLEVKDKGKGISTELHSRISSGESSGMGFRGMRERIHQFGGRLDIYPQLQGTAVIAVLPISNATDNLADVDIELQSSSNKQPAIGLGETGEQALPGT